MTEADHQHHKLIILNLADDPVAADAGILIDQSKFGAHIIKRTCRGFATLQLFQFKPCEVEIFEIVHSMRDQFLKEKGFLPPVDWASWSRRASTVGSSLMEVATTMISA